MELSLVFNPEFLREGHCWEDFTHADRIVLGVSDGRSEEVLRRLYAKEKAPVFCVSLNTGEFIKYLSNTSLACLISYANEMSMAADAIGGIDVANAFRILHMDKRWQTGTIRAYFYPGCGYGGGHSSFSVTGISGGKLRQEKARVKTPWRLAAGDTVLLIPDRERQFFYLVMKVVDYGAVPLNRAPRPAR